MIALVLALAMIGAADDSLHDGQGLDMILCDSHSHRLTMKAMWDSPFDANGNIRVAGSGLDAPIITTPVMENKPKPPPLDWSGIDKKIRLKHEQKYQYDTAAREVQAWQVAAIIGFYGSAFAILLSFIWLSNRPRRQVSNA